MPAPGEAPSALYAEIRSRRLGTRAAVADPVLLLVRELGHRAALAPGTKIGSYPDPRPRGVPMRCLRSALRVHRAAVGPRSPPRTVPSRPSAGSMLATSPMASRGSPRRSPRPREPRRARSRPAVQRIHLDARSSAIAGTASAEATARAFSSAFGRYVSWGLRTSGQGPRGSPVSHPTGQSRQCVSRARGACGRSSRRSRAVRGRSAPTRHAEGLVRTLDPAPREVRDRPGPPRANGSPRRCPGPRPAAGAGHHDVEVDLGRRRPPRRSGPAPGVHRRSRR